MFHHVSRGQADEEAFGKVYDQRVVARMIPFIVPYKGFVALAFVAMLGYTLTQVAVPWLIKLGIDGFVNEGDSAGLQMGVRAVYRGGPDQLGLQLYPAALDGEGRRGRTLPAAPGDVRPTSKSSPSPSTTGLRWGGSCPAYTGTRTSCRSSCPLW